MTAFLAFTTGLFLGALAMLIFCAWALVSRYNDTLEDATEQLETNKQLLKDALNKDLITVNEI